MKRNYYSINEAGARIAHQMMSFRDYVPDSKTAEYRQECDQVYELAEKALALVPDSSERIENLADRFARRLAANYNNDIRIGQMCPSVMISGAGNFPTRKKERQVKAWDANREDYKDIQKIPRQIQSIINGKDTIRSEDANALEKLQKKLDGLKTFQAQMKSVNAHYRKHKTLDGADLTENERKSIEDMWERGWYVGVPFPSYALSNNNAEIHRIEDRIKKLSSIREAGSSETVKKFFTVKENPDDMRIELYFEDKPSEEIRDILKHNGFRWSPRKSAWQRQLTDNGKRAVEYVQLAIEKLSA